MLCGPCGKEGHDKAVDQQHQYGKPCKLLCIFKHLIQVQKSKDKSHTRHKYTADNLFGEHRNTGHLLGKVCALLLSQKALRQTEDAVINRLLQVIAYPAAYSELRKVLDHFKEEIAQHKGADNNTQLDKLAVIAQGDIVVVNLLVESGQKNTYKCAHQTQHHDHCQIRPAHTLCRIAQKITGSELSGGQDS